jgi:hypothetical protein
MIAALMEDESSGEKLLDAARKLCTAFSDLLKAAEPETKEVWLILKWRRTVNMTFQCSKFLNKCQSLTIMNILGIIMQTRSLGYRGGFFYQKHRPSKHIFTSSKAQ